jgi:hypothetical protein
VHQIVEPLEEVDRRTPPASSGLTGRLQRAHRRWLHPTAAAAARRTRSPRSHPMPFGQHRSLRAAADHSGDGSGCGNAAIPRQPPCGNTGHPPKRSGHATGVAARLVSAEAVDDQRPSQRYRRSSPGVRGKAALSGQAGEGATATGHRPQSDAAADTAVHHMAQLGQLGLYFASGGRSSADRSNSLQFPLPIPLGRPCGRPPRRPSSRRRRHDGRRETRLTLLRRGSPPRGGATRSSDSDSVWAGSNLRLRRQLPMRAHVSRQAGQVVGGRRPRPRIVCGGPAGCWSRGLQNAEGGPGLPLLARPVAPAMPWAGR